MMPPVRRVVTGQTSEGKHTFTHVEAVEPLDMGGDAKWYPVWGWERLPTLPHCPTGAYEPRSVFPASGGMRVNMVSFPAGFGTDKAPESPVPPAERFLKLAAAQSTGGEFDHDVGMHSTDSVDLGFIFSGELTLIQGDGSETTIRAGDVLVQNGAIHAWENRGDQPCMACFVVMGADRNAAA